MQEEYLINKMLKSKTDKELEEELMRIISETKRILEVARCIFEFAEDELIDYYVYLIKAHQSRLDYLIKIAKSKKIKQINRTCSGTYLLEQVLFYFKKFLI